MSFCQLKNDDDEAKSLSFLESMQIVANDVIWLFLSIVVVVVFVTLHVLCTVKLHGCWFCFSFIAIARLLYHPSVCLSVCGLRRILF